MKIRICMLCQNNWEESWEQIIWLQKKKKKRWMWKWKWCIISQLGIGAKISCWCELKWFIRRRMRLSTNLWLTNIRTGNRGNWEKCVPNLSIFRIPECPCWWVHQNRYFTNVQLPDYSLIKESGVAQGVSMERPPIFSILRSSLCVRGCRGSSGFYDANYSISRSSKASFPVKI